MAFVCVRFHKYLRSAWWWSDDGHERPQPTHELVNMSNWKWLAVVESRPMRRHVCFRSSHSLLPLQCLHSIWLRTSACATFVGTGGKKTTNWRQKVAERCNLFLKVFHFVGRRYIAKLFWFHYNVGSLSYHNQLNISTPRWKIKAIQRHHRNCCLDIEKALKSAKVLRWNVANLGVNVREKFNAIIIFFTIAVSERFFN